MRRIKSTWLFISSFVLPSIVISCSIGGYDRQVDNQPLENPLPLSSIEKDGSIKLANGKRYYIAGIKSVHPVINSVNDIERYGYCSYLWRKIARVKHEVQVDPLYTDKGKEFANIYLAVAPYRCGTCTGYPVFFKDLIAGVLLNSGLCEIDYSIKERFPELYDALIKAPRLVKEGDIVVIFNLRIVDVKGKPAKAHVWAPDNTLFWEEENGSYNDYLRFNKEDIPQTFEIRIYYGCDYSQRADIEIPLSEATIVEGKIYKIDKTLTIPKH